MPTDPTLPRGRSNSEPGSTGTPRAYRREIGWIGATAMAMGGSNQMLFLIGALVASQGSAAIPLLIVGLLLSWFALPGWTELVLMWPNRVGGIAAACAEAFRPYSPVLANLTGTCYWWGWVPTCGLTALLSAAALHTWYLPFVPVKVLASLLVLIFTVINLSGIRRVTRLAVVIASGSAVLAFLSALVPILSRNVDWHLAFDYQLQVPFDGIFGKFTSAMSGLYLIGFAAPAFEAAACHVGEMVDPEKNLPRAMYASALMATLYFLVLPVVWLGVFGPAALRADLAELLGPTFAPLLGGLGKAAAVWFMILNMFHGTLTPVTGVARTLSQLSEDGLLPKALAKRSRTDVPWVASALTGAMAIGFLLSGDPVWVIAAANFTYLIGISLPSVAVWLLRRNEPDLPRPYRAPRGTIGLGLFAAGAWGITTIFGFEQFGLPTVLAGLGLAYSGAAAFAWRQRQDRAGGPRRVKRSLHVKLTGAMLAVLTLDGAGYALAVSHVTRTDPMLITVLQDIFVAVAVLTITVGLVLPGMIAHSVTEVTDAADRLVSGTLADLGRAMRALADGNLDEARARVENRHVTITSADEVGAMAASFNIILDGAADAAHSLDGAREALLRHRNDLELAIAERTVHGVQQTAVAELGRFSLIATQEREVLDYAIAVVNATMPGTAVELIRFGESGEAVDDHDMPHDTPHDTPHEHGPDGPTGSAQGLVRIMVKHRLFGGLSVKSDDPLRQITETELHFLETIATVTGTALDRIRTEAELNHLAMHDPLTGLPNRLLFRDRLDLALARLERVAGNVAVMFVDVDNFKVINDSLGHDQGDVLLQQLAVRLQAAVRTGDTVARLGGDEYAVLCDGVRGTDEAQVIGEHIAAPAAQPFLLDGREYVITVSVGISLTASSDASTVSLLRDADAAMYSAKESGRASVKVFSDSLRTSAVKRMETELALRIAICEGQLCVHYQPVLELSTGNVTGLEALVRWNHPVNGLTFPDEFIAIAEQTGLIVPLGEWVLNEACREVQFWRASNPQLANLRIAVNLSGRQIAERGLAQFVSDTLARTGLPSANLVLEITESVLMKDPDQAVAALTSLKALGVTLSVDDFGTGYSSLSYLKKFPVDGLKIDRSFVDGLGSDSEDRAIVKATIGLAKSLGLETVAEGVETQVHEDELRLLGCDKVQGYLYCRPVPAQQAFDYTCTNRDRNVGGGASGAQAVDGTASIGEVPPESVERSDAVARR